LSEIFSNLNDTVFRQAIRPLSASLTTNNTTCKVEIFGVTKLDLDDVGCLSDLCSGKVWDSDHVILKQVGTMVT